MRTMNHIMSYLDNISHWAGRSGLQMSTWPGTVIPRWRTSSSSRVGVSKASAFCFVSWTVYSLYPTLNLYLTKQYGARRAFSELPDKRWKLGSIDSVLKRIRKRVPIRLRGSGRQRSARSSGWLCAQSGGQANKASVSSLDCAWKCHSLFKCTQKNISPWSPAQMLQKTSCTAFVWSQLYLSSHSLINNLIICNKCCYCFVINRKLNKK